MQELFVSFLLLLLSYYWVDSEIVKFVRKLTKSSCILIMSFFYCSSASSLGYQGCRFTDALWLLSVHTACQCESNTLLSCSALHHFFGGPGSGTLNRETRVLRLNVEHATLIIRTSSHLLCDVYLIHRNTATERNKKFWFCQTYIIYDLTIFCTLYFYLGFSGKDIRNENGNCSSKVN